jgi:hypothetical protein
VSLFAAQDATPIDGHPRTQLPPLTMHPGALEHAASDTNRPHASLHVWGPSHHSQPDSGPQRAEVAYDEHGPRQPRAVHTHIVSPCPLKQLAWSTNVVQRGAQVTEDADVDPQT